MLSWLRRRRFDPTPREETWRFDPSWERDGRDLRDLWVAVHPARVPRVVVMLPGWRGSLDGYAQKYAKLGALLAERGVGAVVRAGNPVYPGHAFETTCKTSLRGLVEGALERAPKICGDPRPEVFLLGWSAGASAMAAMAADLPRVEKLLLFAPSGDAGDADVIDGLRRFAGDLFVVYGAADDVVGDLPRHLFGYAEAARSRRLLVWPDCDHQFKGAHNGRLMSHAPLWAFAGDGEAPCAERGIHLYD